MDLHNFTGAWILHLLSLFYGLAIVENTERTQPRNHTQDKLNHGTVFSNNTNHTVALLVQPLCHSLQQTNFVWTDSMTDGQFENFRFGIGLSIASTSNNKIAKETLASLLKVRGTDQVYVTVTAETNQSGVALVTTSCKLLSKRNTTRLYVIQDGCLDKKTAQKITMEDNKMVFTLRLSGVTHAPGSSMVFISCEVKLCLKSNYSNSCGSNCSSTFFSKQPNESQLETRTYHVTAEPIYVIWEKRKAVTNYPALVIGMVLGGTVVAVVVLLVRKSFSGVRRRNILVDL
ncbi:uncharacterized protein LOC120917322 isoform X2 [Rana temporaria]|uniref:uncharacterized protein LOC120917322 isoform X2 n=1 Tax=Rana temporaria TaxID=8407 RepID=UPI001AACB538|nr:uncharacterized protein LOC120917322 isoform X2 [Rana temporaria]